MAFMVVIIIVRYRMKGMLGCGGVNIGALDMYGLILSNDF